LVNTIVVDGRKARALIEAHNDKRRVGRIA
jgi:hypothetical protein